MDSLRVEEVVPPKELVADMRRQWNEHMQRCVDELRNHFGDAVTISTHVSEGALDLVLPHDHVAADYDTEALIGEVKRACQHAWSVTIKGEEDESVIDFSELFDELVEEEED